MPAFTTLLKRVAEYYREQRDELRAQNDTLMDVFGDLTPAPVDGDVALTARRSMARASSSNATFDKRYGGFGDAPKFPHPGPSTGCCVTGIRPPSTQDARSARAVHGDTHAHAHGRGRHVRPARRRLRALLGRPVLDDSALRKNAVRQRRAARDAMRKRRSPRAMRCSSASPRETGEWMMREMQDPHPRMAAASIPPTTPTPKATKASSTCGRATRRGPR